MNKKQRVQEILARLKISISDPKSELNYSSVFELLVAVMLSAQTTDQRVNEVTKILFKEANTPLTIANLGEEQLFERIKSIGLAGSKTRNLIKTCQILHEKFNDEVPSTYQELISLPGVGGKTARVVLNVGFNEPVIAVDTHIKRVAQRLKLSASSDPDKISTELTKIIPQDDLLHAHHYLLLHGRRICKARNPLCIACTLFDLCSSSDKIKQ